MEPTITQSSALYLAQHRISNRRTQFFQRLRIASRNSLPIFHGGLSPRYVLNRDFIGTTIADSLWLYSPIAIVDHPLPFTTLESEESDPTAQQRWESEGGNPGQLRQLPSNKNEEITTDAADASHSVLAVLREANDRVLLQAVHHDLQTMPKQKRKHDFAGSRSIPKRDMPRSEIISPKQRKQLAHNAPVRRAASKFRE
jgi:hypothetical protein